jgi:putative DNA methylase
MPLVKSFILSTKKDRESFVEPKIVGNKVNFNVVRHTSNQTEGTVNRNGAHCVVCSTPVPFETIRIEGQSGRMGVKLLAIVAETKKGRVYLSPTPEHEKIALSVVSEWKPETELSGKAAVNVPLYGLRTHGDLFVQRQLVVLDILANLVKEAHKLIIKTSVSSSDRDVTNYANSVALYLGLSVSRSANTLCSLAVWSQGRDQSVNAFSRQALAMTWDFPEVNPFASAAGDFKETTASMAKCIDALPACNVGTVNQFDATKLSLVEKTLISTDPPYYDNISYADLSDFFYVWVRSALAGIFPDLLATVLVPKAQELVATPYRFEGNKRKAEEFFEKGLRHVFENFRKITFEYLPTTIFYAFKQTETDQETHEEQEKESRASTGWETMLTGLVESNFQITGTWPMRTERPTGVKTQMNALASSIILVCRPRLQSAPSSSRREFLSALKKELAPALRELQQGSIAPVDLAQAAIGPGMAIYSRYSAVLEADGMPMSVRTALTLINQALDEFLAEQEGEYDGDTRWALTWFEQYGHNEAAYGIAETLSNAKNTSVNGLSEAGIVEARGGKVRLYRRDELDTDWDPTQDKRLTAWESAAHLIYALENGGEESAAALLARLGPVAEVARDLAYRLYTICERKGWAQDALGYNMLVVAWPRLKELSARQAQPGQGKLL